jgi:hypothetical protein
MLNHVLIVPDGNRRYAKKKDIDISVVYKYISDDITTKLIKEQLGEDFNVACVGIAGENLVRYAGIFNDAHRPAGSGPGRNIQVHCLDENPGGWPKIRKFNPQTSSRQIPGSGSGPLAYNPFDPDIVLIYGNPAR